MGVRLVNKRLLRKNFYSTHYFLKTKNILEKNEIELPSVIQFKSFCKKSYMVAGVWESIKIIKAYLPRWEFNKIKIYYLDDGSIVNRNQCVLSIEGPYYLICCLENIIDGVLARRSSVANNCFNFLHYLNSNQLIFMSDRSDDYQLMPFDGYAAYIAGVRNFSNNAHIHFVRKKKDVFVVGTMPHALIQQFNGDINKTFNAYDELYPNNGVVLVDYENDIIKTLSKLKKDFNKIIAIRIDTANNMLDSSLKKHHANKKYYGASIYLFKLVRKWLDENDGKHIKIICSSGNNLQKIRKFIKADAPVDIYGIGTALIDVNIHFTADLVKLNGKNQAKKGRRFFSIEGMKLYRNEKLGI